MKWLICLWLGVTSSASLQQVVQEFHALKTEKAELHFVSKYQNSKNVSIKAYVLAVQMKQAEHTMNPISKIKIFRKYKNKFDALIKLNPKNVHARYMRLVIQEKMPAIMGYNGSIQKDKKVLRVYFSEHAESNYLINLIKKNTSL